MKKVFFWAIAILATLTILGSNIASHTTVAGIQTTATPTFAATATPTALPTVIPSATPTPTTKQVSIAPTYTPTPIPTVTTSQSGLSNDRTYTNVDGMQVHSPAYSNSIPAGATAICGDGTYSFSLHHSGTCSHHSGVSQWL